MPVELGTRRINPCYPHVYIEDISFNFTRDRLDLGDLGGKYTIDIRYAIDDDKKFKSTRIYVVPKLGQFGTEIFDGERFQSIFVNDPTEFRSPRIRSAGIQNGYAKFSYSHAHLYGPESYTGIVKIVPLPDKRYLELIKALEDKGHDADQLKTFISAKHLRMLEGGSWNGEAVLEQFIADELKR